MTASIGNQPSRRSKSRKKKKVQISVQKARGVLGPRVKKVGADKFALVCIDPAKHRSEWLMADYMGNVLIEPRTVEHQSAHFELAVQMVRQAQQQHGILDVLVTVERTSNYHRPAQRAFTTAGFETRIVHPFATKQYRLPADPGNKTDHTDLFAQHRAAIAGFGLQEAVWDECHGQLQLHIRHRRDFVEKASAIACQIRDHLHQALPGYAELFADFLAHPTGMAIARLCNSPQAILQYGKAGLTKQLHEQKIHFQAPTLDKILAWAQQMNPRSLDPTATLHHAIWTDLDALWRQLRRQIDTLECEIAGDLVRTPYVRLLAIPGIHVVSAADFAGEMGPIVNYANSNAITGRSGIFPSRYQSDQTDYADGALVRQCNRRLRATIMRIADNLSRCNAHFRGRAAVARAAKVDERAIRVKIGKKFTRIAFAAVAGDQPLRHPCCAGRESILDKLRQFHLEHGTPPDRVLEHLELAIKQLLPDTCRQEAEILTEVLQQQAQKRSRGPKRLGELLPAVLARLGVKGSQPSPTTKGKPASN